MFFDRFAELCKANGQSPYATAKTAGMSRSNVTNWKNGSSPTLDTVQKLAKQLNVPASAFLDLPEQKEA